MFTFLANTQAAASARTVLAQDAEHFLWIPARKPRGNRATLAAALLGAACVSPGNAPLPDAVRTINPTVWGSAVSRPVATRLVDQGAFDHPHVEHRGAVVEQPTLNFDYQSKAGRAVRGQPGRKSHHLSGEPARRLQAKLSVDENGAFDPITEKALRAWQAENGLAADGIAGPTTLVLMGCYDLVLLKRGSHGDAVRTLQQQLAIGADGRFGPRTERLFATTRRKMASSQMVWLVRRRSSICSNRPEGNLVAVATLRGRQLILFQKSEPRPGGLTEAQRRRARQ
jgi:Putative peptidoglycan binding domain